MRSISKILFFIIFVASSFTSIAQEPKSVDQKAQEKARAEAEERARREAEEKQKAIFKKYENAKSEVSNRTAVESFSANAYRQINSKHVAWVKSTASKIAHSDMDYTQIKNLAFAYGLENGINKSGTDGLVILLLHESVAELKKESLRAAINIEVNNDKKEDLQGVLGLFADSSKHISSEQLDSIDLTLNITSKIEEPIPAVEKQMPIAKRNESSTEAGRSFNNRTVTSLTLMQTKEKVEERLGQLNERNEMETLRLQDMIQRQNKLQNLLSNIMKQVSDSQNEIIQNLK